ncbi:hypothetical protein [Streptomyces chrestomyceticus]|uniref:hypothetical protein n=1 Tax=Streptomyces chrestomyceticus TaxID=68185 RepID=UPI0035A888C2
MQAPRYTNSWQHVACRADFAAYLSFLSIDCERACNGQASEAPASQHWLHRNIDDFLWSWAHLLSGRLNGTGLLHEEGPGRPGWRGLAYQLDTARTAPPEPQLIRALAVSGTKPEEVDTAGALLMYAASLATDFSRDQRDCQTEAERGEWTGDGGSWAHGTLYDWFEAWGAWVGADSPRHAGLEPVTWRSIAVQLSVARSYE